MIIPGFNPNNKENSEKKTNKFISKLLNPLVKKTSAK